MITGKESEKSDTIVGKEACYFLPFNGRLILRHWEQNKKEGAEKRQEKMLKVWKETVISLVLNSLFV